MFTLIVNGIITNSLKHAFSDTHKDYMQIKIEVSKNSAGEIELSIFDNGQGDSTR